MIRTEKTAPRHKLLMCRLLGHDYDISVLEYDDNGMLRYTKDQCARCGHGTSSYANWHRSSYKSIDALEASGLGIRESK